MVAYSSGVFSRRCAGSIASRALDVYTVAPTLFLANDHTAHTELCSLFLDQAHRHASNGPLLAKSRLLFIAEFAERFAPKVIAEMRGRLDAAAVLSMAGQTIGAALKRSDGAAVLLMRDGQVAFVDVAGMQDAASQFVQLTWLFTTQPQLPTLGQRIELPA